MTGKLQPLEQTFAIVGSDGRPTPYFIRWAQQRQIDITASITAENATQLIVDYLASHPLIAGSGIALTPSGNLSNSPVVAALVQQILDQITTVHGSVLYRDAAAWAALGPGTAGQFLRTNGPAADPDWAAGGSGSSGWNLLDQNGGTINSGATWTFSVAVANVDVINLSNYNELIVIGRNLTTTLSTQRIIRVSVDNGVTFFQGAADYEHIQSAGNTINSSVYLIHTSNSAAARAITGHLVNLKGPVKFARDLTADTRLFAASTLGINAIRLSQLTATTFTGGTLHVYAR